MEVCSHYNINCRIQCPDCKKFYPCRLCHDLENDHKMDRFKVDRVQCCKCQHIQTPNISCQQCHTVFGQYYCSTCRLWTHRQSFHCDKCGICRNGSDDDYHHCDTCNMCMSKDHQCIQNLGENQCPICLEVFFDSFQQFVKCSCRHLIHIECLREYLKFDYRCPLCKKSLYDVQAYWDQIDRLIADDNYDGGQREIFCNDCLQRCLVKYHPNYNKCVNCGGYNTS